MVLLPATDPSGSKVAAERILNEIETCYGFERELGEMLDRELHLPREAMLSCSIGIANFDWDQDFEIDKFINRADSAAYRAKREGGGRYCD